MLVPRESRQRGALLARSLLRAGIINEHTLALRASADYVKTCQAALEQWLNGALAGLHFLRPLFRLTIGACEPGELEASRSANAARLEWFGQSAGVVEVGPALDRLEAHRPKLGNTVLRAIEDVSFKTLPLYTPAMVLEAASDVYWYGEEDEDVALEENCGEDAEARAQMRDSMVTRGMFDATFPKWALGWRGGARCLSERALRESMRAVRDRRVAAVFEDVLALRSVGLPAYDWSTEEGRFMGFAGLLTWGASDRLSLRVIDDYQQMIGESGEYFEHCGAGMVAIDRPEHFTAWLRYMQAWCAALRLLDGLICKLADPHWTQAKRGRHGA